MTAEQDYIKAARFGYGIRPGETLLPPNVLMQFGDNNPAISFGGFPNTLARRDQLLALRQARREDGTQSSKYQRLRTQMRSRVIEDFRFMITRPVLSPQGFKERIFAFWLDHFTVSPQGLHEQVLLGGYFEDAIRPHLTGRFSELLKAVITHPSMLLYLDQNASVGPNSPGGQRRDRGLNENLAREVLELHTLGVRGGYSQNDVRQFAELLTGLTVTQKGTEFLNRIAEPGAETILGVTYGAAQPGLSNILEFLEDLSLHPNTARHLAEKLAVHFVGPDPDPDFTASMAENYLASGGELTSMYDVLLNHQQASLPLGQKARTPFEYVVASLRALEVPARVFNGLSARDIRNGLMQPLLAMGQPPFRPSGPDGWSEALETWISPPTLAARINWAAELAGNYASRSDPRQRLETVLGPLASDDLEFAVTEAETKWEGTALMLISPEFMRR